MSFSFRKSLYLKMLPIKQIPNRTIIISNHQVLYTTVNAVCVPKSFSIKVAVAMAIAKANNAKTASFGEKSSFMIFDIPKRLF